MQEANNWQPNAVIDDGSCEFTLSAFEPPSGVEEYTLGCLDPAASNYQEGADYDDGQQCQYTAGCTNPAATNYNPEADYDDGLCEFVGVPPTNFEEAQYTLGCKDEAASNYDEDADYDDGEQCQYIGGCMQVGADNYNPEAVYDDGNCSFLNPSSVPDSVADYQVGCTDPEAQNTTAGAVVDDGSCEYIDGCMNPSATNYNPSAQYDSGNCLFNQSVAPESIAEYQTGCTDPDALNTTPNAVVDDGSCQYQEGCTLQEASNWQPNAVIDDGSCEFELSAFEPPSGIEEYTFVCGDPNASNFVDSSVVQATAGLAYNNSTCEYAEGCTQPNALNYDASVGIDDGSCLFAFSLTANQVLSEDDARAISANCGIANYSNLGGLLDNPLNPTIGELSSAIKEVLGSPCFTIGGPTAAPDSAQYMFGCTDPLADNATAQFIIDTYESQGMEFITDNSLCNYSGGCTNTNGLNFNSEALFDDGSCVFTSSNPSTEISVDQANAIVENTCGPLDQNLVLDIAGSTGGGLTLADLNTIVQNRTGSPCFAFAETYSPTDFDGVYAGGCTNPDADNYDENASFDDNSCEFDSLIGCTNPDATNYEPTAQFDSGQCTFAEVQYDFSQYESASSDLGGCTNSQADNYNPNATFDDESCTFDNLVGCTNPDATNFDPSAQFDSGQCAFPEVEYDLTAFESAEEYVGGCIDPSADNYDENADFDDESCTFDSKFGCTQQSAQNWNPDASIDNGSCVWVPEAFEPESMVYGCTYEAATNYNVQADVDDGSCTFTPQSCDLGGGPSSENEGQIGVGPA